MEFNIIIAGSRTFNDLKTLTDATDKFLATIARMHFGRNVTVISGTAQGADKLGEKYAGMHKYKVTQMPADWERFGKRAGYLRNEEMAKIAHACIVFWKDQSHGSKNMIEIARAKGIPTAVIEPAGNGFTATYYNLKA